VCRCGPACRYPPHAPGSRCPTYSTKEDHSGDAPRPQAQGPDRACLVSNIGASLLLVAGLCPERPACGVPSPQATARTARRHAAGKGGSAETRQGAGGLAGTTTSVAPASLSRTSTHKCTLFAGGREGNSQDVTAAQAESTSRLTSLSGTGRVPCNMDGWLPRCPGPWTAPRGHTLQKLVTPRAKQTSIPSNHGRVL